MTHGSLFSGIGGFDLAAEWVGWNNVFHCEINDFCNKVLNYYWPDAKSYTDIKTTDFSVWNGRLDVLSGGFPCQPYSAAGKRKGKEDDRHLWPEMLRAIREIQPRWVVGENVYGLVNWSGGLVFDEVQSDLENEGYEVTPYILPACAVNAPHRRDRVWFVAYLPKIPGGNMGDRRIQCFRKETKKERSEDWFKFFLVNSGTTPVKWRSEETGIDGEPSLVSDEYGIPQGLVGTSFSKYIDQCNGAAGNAIVPELVYRIFKAIEQYECKFPT